MKKDKNVLLLSAALTGLLFVAGCAKDKGNVQASTSGATGECHGINSCKATGECGGKGHMCAGKNACKGKGWLKMSQSDCKSKGGKFKAS